MIFNKRGEIMLYSLDRIEGNIAVFINKNKELKTDINNIFPKIKESYLYDFINEKFILNEEESKKIKSKNYNKFKKLIKK